MHKAKGLFVKIYGLILVPTMAFLILSGVFIEENFDKYSESAQTNNSIPIIRSSINLLSSLQVERGMSISHVNGAKNKSLIIDHREKVNSNFDRFKKLSAQLGRYKEELNVIDEALALRNQIFEKKAPKALIAQKYTLSVRSLMNLVREKIIKIENKDLVTSLMNIITLLEAGENGGLLRANVSAVISRANGLSKEESNQIKNLKQKFESYLESPSLLFKNETSKKLKSDFQKNPKLNEVSDHVEYVLENPNTTKYSINSGTFFSLISDVLRENKEIIYNEIDFIEEVSTQVEKNALQNLITLSLVIGMYLILASLFTYFIVFKLVRKFRDNLHTLNNKSTGIISFSKVLEKNANMADKVTKDQAEAISSSSESIYQIATLVKANTELAKDVENQANESTQTTQEGSTQVQNLLKSIEGIASSQNGLVSQLKANNKKFETIVTTINEISNKTEIINDIVFQTKLLSFNASVEAARAGEHGKGFSVVAEEIGQLATLSGKASEEIAGLVSSSCQMVENMTKEMVNEIETQVKKSEIDIQNGVKEAKSFEQIFNVIYEKVSKVQDSMRSLLDSSQEQTEAMDNISRNIQTLQDSTKESVNTVEKNLSITKKVADSGKVLQHSIDEMAVNIRGEKITFIKKVA